MTSHIFLKETIWRNQFRSNNLKNKEFFWIFFGIFEIYTKFETFVKKDDPDSWCISGYTASEKYG